MCVQTQFYNNIAGLLAAAMLDVIRYNIMHKQAKHKYFESKTDS